MTKFDTLDHTADETAVKDLLGRMVAAWGAHDADAFTEMYSDDASVVTSASYTQGKDAIRAFMTAGFAGPLKGTTSVEQPQQIRFVGSDVAIVNSISGFIPPGEKAVPAALQRRATWVLARGGNGWLVESYHNSAAN